MIDEYIYSLYKFLDLVYFKLYNKVQAHCDLEKSSNMS